MATAIQHHKTTSRNNETLTVIYLKLIEIELDKYTPENLHIIPLDDLAPSIYNKEEAANRIIYVLEELNAFLLSGFPFWYRTWIKAGMFFKKLWRR